MTNELPSYYYDNYKQKIIYEMKLSSVIGIIGHGGYSTLITINPWENNSVAIVQIAITELGYICRRNSNNSNGSKDEWNNWELISN